MSALSRTDADRRLEAALQRHKNGDIEFAYQTYRNVLAQYPEHPTALHYLGLVAQQVGHAAEAASLLRRSIDLNPLDPRAFNHLGQIVLSQGRLDEAIRCFVKALNVDPRHVDSLNSLANGLKARGELRAATDLYRRVLKISPSESMSTYNLANALKEVGDYDEALEMFERALACDPDHLASHLNLGILLEQKGRFDEAVRHYESVLRLKPEHPKALSNLVAIRSYQPNPQFVHTAEQRLKDTDSDNGDRIKLHYGLGQHYDRQKDFDRAFQHFSAANEIVKARSGRFDPQQVSEYFERIIQTFSADYFARLSDGGSSSERPIFIIGMPRSGTTLTEQILACHPAIFGAGELQDVLNIVKSLKPHYPDALLNMPKHVLKELARRYLTALERRAPTGVVRITDKLPVNFTHLGLIATLFPRARVVHCRRDPLDVGLSCFIEQFDLKRDFTTDLESFGNYFLQYERLMEHWQKVLPLSVHEQYYEVLVADPQVVSRALVAFCGLPWDDACMDFQRADRTVLTPSRWQVRQPIYKSSVGRWRNYSVFMQPLKRLLNERGYRYDLATGVSTDNE